MSSFQKSTREGFALGVSQALWKGTPVAAGRAGGIPLQLQDDNEWCLVDTVEECAEKTLWLLENSEQALAIATKGRELVRERFLLPRLIGDELRLCNALLKITPSNAAPLAKVGLAGEYRDPVCGMHVDTTALAVATYSGLTYHFCNESCRRQFQESPDRFIHGHENGK